MNTLRDRFGGGSRQEIDLRLEISNTLFGSVQEIPKAYKVLIRRMRTDDRGFRIPCVCNHHGEGSTLPACSLCLGEGWLWDERWESVFKYPIGSNSAKARRSILEHGGVAKSHFEEFIFQHTIDIIRDDRIVEVRRDAAGDFAIPYERREVWNIETVDEYRSDNGRLEFVIAFCAPVNEIANSYRRR